MLKLLPLYKEQTVCVAGISNTIAFWRDKWKDQVLQISYPQLSSFCINIDITLQKVLELPNMEDMFHLPLSSQAYQQFQHLQAQLQDTGQLTERDKWGYPWNSNNFSVMKMYKALLGPSTCHMIFKLLWKSAAQLRYKFFFWLLLYDRIKTRNLLKRKSMYLEDYNCAICHDKTEETLMHLFWDCNFALECWNQILPNRRRGISSFNEICLRTSDLPQDMALDIIIAGCWSIWSVRNDKIFRRLPLTQ